MTEQKDFPKPETISPHERTLIRDAATAAVMAAKMSAGCAVWNGTRWVNPRTGGAA